ncbi:hypothetical protein BN12_2620007 [Nostocoides japonicum T1-X7]|uniref:Uncharacterized protein n=1 Tax=Nostocoides japonicum T1-X7 TaxID=1194083 RepID=A0A077LZ83_9MICO|nr:hypothetical protein BN12_2620007 [Tetrasphaera japonica T1-X7]
MAVRHPIGVTRSRERQLYRVTR